MPDNVQLNGGAGGDVAAADDIGGVKYQRVKLTLGADGVNGGDVASGNPLPVTLPPGAATEATLASLQAVDAAALGAPTDAEATGDGSLIAILKRIRTGSDVLATVASLDKNLATDEALAGIISAVGGTADRLGATDETAPATDTTTSGLNGRLQRIAQRITSLLALLPSALSNGFFQVSLKETITQPVSGTFWQATQPVSGPVTDAQLRASAVPVSGTFFQATQPVSATTLPLPTGASTEATLALIKAKTDNLDVAISTRTKPADQQHVIVDSSAVVAVTGPLTDAQLRATAVPVSAASLPLPTGAATETTLGTRLADATFTGRINTQGQKTMAGSTPVVLASDQAAVPVTANAGTNLNTSLLALEAGGNLAAIKADVDKIPSQGQALAAASLPVVLTAAQITTLTPPAAITGFALETTQGLQATAVKQDLLLAELQLKADLTETQPVSLASAPAASADVLAVDASAGYTAGDLAKKLTQTPDGRLRTLASGLVSDVPESYLDGVVRALSLTSEGRLRVSAVPADITNVWNSTFDNPWAETNDDWTALPNGTAVNFSFAGEGV